LLGEAQPKASRAHSSNEVRDGEAQPKASRADQEPEPGAFEDEVGDVD
jgi:hypothetical protein